MAFSRRSFLRAAALSVGAIGLGTPAAAGALTTLPSTAREVLQVVVARPQTAAHRAALARFDDTHAMVDGGVELLLWPGDLARLQATGMPFEVTVTDLLTHERDAAIAAEVAPNALPVPGDVTDYRDLEEFYADFDLLVTMAEADPELTVEVIELPNASFEGRTVKAVEIYLGDGHDGRGVAYVDGCHHAREWPAAEYCAIYARWLVETALDSSADKHGRVTDMLGAVRVRICPVINVDGFAYSRSWAGTALDNSTLGIVAGGQGAYVRKTKRNNPVTTTGVESPVFYGVDPNRNYAYLWGGTTGGLLTVGDVSYPLFASTSANPIDQTYYGTEPFSEPEVDNNRQFFLTNNVITYLSNHTQGRLILRPWGHTTDACPDDALLTDLGARMSVATEHDGLVGYENKIGLGLYPTIGTSNDWAYAATGTLGYVIENSLGNFHPAYSSLHGPGNAWPSVIEMFLIASEEAALPRAFSTLTGTITDADGQPTSAVLVLTKTFSTPFQPLDPTDPTAYQGTGQLTALADSLEETIRIELTTRPDGTFTWHVNPSTRPIAELEGATETWTLTADTGLASTSVEFEIARGESKVLDLQVG